MKMMVVEERFSKGRWKKETRYLLGTSLINEDMNVSGRKGKLLPEDECFWRQGSMMTSGRLKHNHVYIGQMTVKSDFRKMSQVTALFIGGEECGHKHKWALTYKLLQWEVWKEREALRQQNNPDGPTSSWVIERVTPFPNSYSYISKTNK